MSKLEYDISNLLECIEERPCLWNPNIDGYKDHNLKKRSWREICQHIENDFFQLDKKVQKEIGDAIKSKWHNIRDAFVRSLRQKGESENRRKYIYHDELKFLLKIMQKEEVTSNYIEYTEYKQESDNNSLDTPTTSRDISTRSHVTWSNAKRKRHDSTESDSIVLESPRVDPNVLGEDEAFFHSLIPSVKRMSEDEKLEFRMEVLQVVRNIRKKRNEVTIEYVPVPNFE